MTLSIRCFHSFKLLAPGVAMALVVLLPTTARAETSNEKVYEPAVPSIESEPNERVPKPHTPRKSHLVNPPGHAADEPDRSSAPTTGEEADHRTPTKTRNGPEPKERRHHHEALPVKADNGTPAGGGRPNERPSTGVSARPADGGSSPAVPILIAVALLAATSIGAVLYRGRKSQAGPTGI